jgi:carboxypeptidase Taq
MDTQQKLAELRSRLAEIADLNGAAAVLAWDQQVYMPPGGAAARGRIMGTLARLAHDRFVDPAVGKLLDDLHAYGDSLPFDSDDAALIRVTRRNYEREVKIPSAFISEFYAHSAQTYQAWVEARPANDWAKVHPLLEKTLDMSRRYADYLGPYQHIADPLIDGSDYGMKAETIRTLFAELRAELVPIVKAITEQPPADDSFLHQDYPREGIEAFSKAVIERYGYDFNRGRLDTTAHPFAIKFAIGDVRITTRYPKHSLSDPLFSTLHESGHAMYEQGVSPALEGTPLDGGTSSGVHESQSRLWENIVGRSREFWSHFYPMLQAQFPAQLGHVGMDQFYRAVNKVQRSLIRTEADEVTYNLHVMIRFDFELALLEGTMALKDLPEAWHARYQADLGVRAPDDRDGCLQDVHWYAGLIGGAFQGYTLGNLFSAQFYAKALQAHPDIPAQIGRGEFGTLHTWMRENIYQHGSKFTAPELLQRTVGEFSIKPYMQYLKTKYGQLYPL